MRARRDTVRWASDRIARSNGWSRASSSEQSTGDTPILGLLSVRVTTAAITQVTHALALVAQDALGSPGKLLSHFSRSRHCRVRLSGVPGVSLRQLIIERSLAAAATAGDSASSFEAFRRGDFERMIALMQGKRRSLHAPGGPFQSASTSGA